MSAPGRIAPAPPPTWRVAAASVRGASHERLSLPCQDAHQWALLPDSFLVAAVADGAGSALLAEIGAAVAVSATIEAARRRFTQLKLPNLKDDSAWHELLKELLSGAREAVEQEANSRALPARDLACTLSLVIATTDFAASIQVGDGAVLVATPQGEMTLVNRPVQGECLNETIFLTSPEALEHAQTGLWRGHLGHVAVFSDGLQMAALRMPAAEPHPGFFTPLFQFVGGQAEGPEAHEALANFLTSPRLRDRTDDDVTLLLAALLP
ncbi:MAG TPA: PP2C family serine/threonine-protein phosphatase [Verrucomicrobiae bacterium]|nr:PP2C family serine/threonine-protein phosphatase [Verrucomicrobiae bacterium]